MSVLVTTQTKVSSGVAVQSRHVEEQHQRFVRPQLRLCGRDVSGSGLARAAYSGKSLARQRRSADPGIDWARRARSSCSACGLRRFAGRETAAVSSLSCDCHSVARSCRSRTVWASALLPLASRADIWAIEAAAPEPCAHCAARKLSSARRG